MARGAWVFRLDAAYRWGGRFAFRFLHPGMAVVDGVLPVLDIDGSTVSHGLFYAQG
jgi:hypothetical protein